MSRPLAEAYPPIGTRLRDGRGKVQRICDEEWRHGHGAMLGVLLVATMLLTPLIHHAAAVLIMGPVAATIARHLGVSIDPFLMAVAVGASCDFLSPIGHQCNTLVMGPGGYRFGDYWHLGLPLSALVAICGVPLILLAWPLH